MKIAIIVCLSAVSIASIGQSYDSTARVLSFDEAVKIALDKSVTLNQQRNNFEMTQVQKTSGYAGLGPTVQGSLSASRNDGNYFNTNAGRVVNGVNDNISGSITASINLFSGFNQINTIRQYSSQLEAQNYLVHRTSQDVINAVSTQYLQVMLDTELLRIAIENFAALQKQSQLVKEQVNLGSRSPVDEYNQNASTKAAELRYVQAEIQLNNDKAILAQTLQMDPFEQFNVERPSWDVNTFDTDALNVEELANRAKQSRGDYLSAQKTVDAQRFSRYAAIGAMSPSLVAFFRYGSAYNRQHDVPDSVQDRRTIIVADPTQPSGYGFGVEYLGTISNPEKPRPFDEQFRTNNVYKTFGLQLTIPIFNGLQNRTTQYRQKVAYRNAQLTRNNLELQIRSDVLRAVRNYEGARRAYSITSDQLKAAEVALQLETERFNLGVTSFVDFANSNRVFVQTQTDKAQAEYRLVFQKIVLEYAVGTLKTEDTPANR